MYDSTSYHTQSNRCQFCGELSNYFDVELNCYVCPTCLGKYRKAKNDIVVIEKKYPSKPQTATIDYPQTGDDLTKYSTWSYG
jgi:late competence protein required for DNA uptake (superfamily II DNA/RNA helicase)